MIFMFLVIAIAAVLQIALISVFIGELKDRLECLMQDFHDAHRRLCASNPVVECARRAFYEFFQLHCNSSILQFDIGICG